MRENTINTQIRAAARIIQMWPPWLILGFFFCMFCFGMSRRLSVSLRPWLTLFKPAPLQPFFFFQYKGLPNLFNPLHESLLPALTTSVQPHSPNGTSPVSSFCPPESSLFFFISQYSVSVPVSPVQQCLVYCSSPSHCMQPLSSYD